MRKLAREQPLEIMGVEEAPHAAGHQIDIGKHHRGVDQRGQRHAEREPARRAPQAHDAQDQARRAGEQPGQFAQQAGLAGEPGRGIDQQYARLPAEIGEGEAIVAREQGIVGEAPAIDGEIERRIGKERRRRAAGRPGEIRPAPLHQHRAPQGEAADDDPHHDVRRPNQRDSRQQRPEQPGAAARAGHHVRRLGKGEPDKGRRHGGGPGLEPEFGDAQVADRRGEEQQPRGEAPDPEARADAVEAPEGKRIAGQVDRHEGRRRPGEGRARERIEQGVPMLVRAQVEAQKGPGRQQILLLVVPAAPPWPFRREELQVDLEDRIGREDDHDRPHRMRVELAADPMEHGLRVSSARGWHKRARATRCVA